MSGVEPVIETQGLSKRFGARSAVDGVDLVVPAGTAFGFLGPYRAGETTLIRTLLGLTRPSAGTVRLLGLPQPQERRRALSRIGAIVEEPRFHPHLTGRENLKIVAAARDRTAEGRIPEALERVGLRDRADDRVKTYSLGMRQRLGIARCLLADPALLILDEPMNGLDPAGMLEIRQFVRAFVADGRTVFLSSHLLDVVEKTCDEVAIVDNGKIVVQGAVGAITGSTAALLVTVDDVALARRLIGEHAPAATVRDDGAGTLRLELGDALLPADVNRILVTGGVAVSRLEPTHASLEETFLAITSRLGGEA